MNGLTVTAHPMLASMLQPTQRSKVPIDYVLGVGGFELGKVETQVRGRAGPGTGGGGGSLQGACMVRQLQG